MTSSEKLNKANGLMNTAFKLIVSAAEEYLDSMTEAQVNVLIQHLKKAIEQSESIACVESE